MMRSFRRFAVKLTAIWRKPRLDEDFREELESHFTMMVEEQVRRGVTPEMARREAIARLGGLSQLQELHREWRGLEWLESFAQDVRYAWRGFRREPGFLLTAVAALALGIGSATAVFSIVDRILFRSLPYAGAERLFSIGVTLPTIEQEFLFGRAYVTLRDLISAQSGTGQIPFEAITSTLGVSDCELGDLRPARLSCSQVESSFLSTLGVSPILGSNFSERDDTPEAPPVVLLAHAFWRTTFGGDPNIAGRSITLDGKPAKILGVLPAEFELPTLEHADLLIPQRVDYAAQRSSNPGRVFRVFARVPKGASQVRSMAALRPLFAEVQQSAPDFLRDKIGLRLRTIRDRQIQDVRKASWLLIGAVGAVYLILCANLVSLLLARALKRRHEIAVRIALGASRLRLLRQALAESFILAAAGGLAGILAARLFVRLAVQWTPQGILRLPEAMVDGRALSLAAGISILTALILGLNPLVHGKRMPELKATPQIGPSRHPLREYLVMGQIAITLVLLVSAGLLIRSLLLLQSESLGLEAERVSTATFVLNKMRYDSIGKQILFFDELERRLGRIPGVTSIAVSDSVPPSGITRSQPLIALTLTGSGPNNSAGGTLVIWRFVSPGYLRTLGVPVVRGRDFSEDDRLGEPKVILNETLARQLFDGREPVGESISVSSKPARVIGVARDVFNGNVGGRVNPEYYVLRQRTETAVYRNQMPPHGWRRASIAVRSVLRPDAITEAMQRELEAVDPSLPVTFESMPARIRSLSERPRFVTTILGGFAACGLALATIGLYGLISVMVVERRREITIRMALGATPGDIYRLVVVSSIGRLVALGVSAGLLVSFAAARFLRAFTYGIGQVDPAAVLLALVTLVLFSLIAVWLPSRRATRAEPMILLREE